MWAPMRGRLHAAVHRVADGVSHSAMLPDVPAPARVRTPLALLLVAAAGLAACGAGGGAKTAATGGTRSGPAGAAPPAAAMGLRLTRIGQFDRPDYLTVAPGDASRLFVVEKGGRIRVVRGGRVLGTPFLDLSGRVSEGTEQGLLSVAFAPDYQRSRRFYVDYTDLQGNTRVVEYRRSARSANRADPGTARQVLFQRQPEANHNGGLLLFGPDRLLYIGLGDGGGAGDRHGPRGNAQVLSTWLGKILRIDPRATRSRPYRIPAGNPFARRRGARPEIWSYGLRNPWRFSFDRLTGALTIGDVGQDEVEEIDYSPRSRGRGVNYGWRVWEGTDRYTPGESAPGATPPVLEYRHGSGGVCSVTGGYVVRDPRLRGWSGRYLYGDFCAGRIMRARLRPGRLAAAGNGYTGLRVPLLDSFGEDGRGRLYAVSESGPVYRIDPR